MLKNLIATSALVYVPRSHPLRGKRGLILFDWFLGLCDIEDQLTSCIIGAWKLRYFAIGEPGIACSCNAYCNITWIVSDWCVRIQNCCHQAPNCSKSTRPLFPHRWRGLYSLVLRLSFRTWSKPPRCRCVQALLCVKNEEESLGTRLDVVSQASPS